MAYTESGEIATGNGYNLGEYSFSIERSSVPGSANDQITAICRQGNKIARKSIQIPGSSQIEGWYVEANETEATVYVKIKAQGVTGGVIPPIAKSSGTRVGSHTTGSGSDVITTIQTVNASGNVKWFCTIKNGTLTICAAADSPTSMPYTIVTYTSTHSSSITGTQNLSSQITKQGKTAYYRIDSASTSGWTSIDPGCPVNSGTITPNDAWLAVYDNDDSTDDVMVGRFSIDIKDAGGYPDDDDDWDEPGDWNEDPYTTLHVEIAGALSGRHNDPIYDTSYSYLPSDKATVKQYGSGGDGGHGGGGGAGASTVVIHRIATNKANSHEATAIARRHGYGSGGGKGGRGGDGIILVYY